MKSWSTSPRPGTCPAPDRVNRPPRTACFWAACGRSNGQGRLFLTRSETVALAALLTDRFGWNLSVYNRMPTPTAMPSAGERAAITYQVTVHKRRAGQGRWFTTENITDSGADSGGRLITQALEATWHARVLAARLAPGTDLLMAARGVCHEPSRDPEAPPAVGPLRFGVSQDSVKLWVKCHQLARLAVPAHAPDHRHQGRPAASAQHRHP